MRELVSDIRSARWVLVLTVLATVWGYLAYRKMPLELLPGTEKMTLIVSLKTPGFSPQEASQRLHKPLLEALRSLGVKSDLVGTYSSHYGYLFSEMRKMDEPEVLRDALQIVVNDVIHKEQMIGSEARVSFEPMINLEMMRLGFPTTRNKASYTGLLQKLRKTPGVSSVDLSESESAWDEGGSYYLATVKMTSEGSLTEISKAVRAALPREVVVLNDDASYVLSSEENLLENVYGGTLLTIVCVFAFVRKLSSTLIVGLSIPMCVLLTIPFLFGMGISNNIMSMAGLALSVGIVVDASLSVVDEFEENMKTGKYLPIQAAHKTVQETFIPLFVATLAASAVFAPILFLEGRVGELFADLSLAVVISNFIGLLVSMIVVPSILATTKTEQSIGTARKSGVAEASVVRSRRAFVLFQQFALRLKKIWTRIFDVVVGSPLLSLVFVCMSFLSVAVVLRDIPPMDFLPPPKQGLSVVELQLPPMSVQKVTSEQLGKDAQKLIGVLQEFKAEGVRVQRVGAKLAAHYKISTTQIAPLEESLRKTFEGYGVYADLDNPLKPFGRQDQDVEFFLDGPSNKITEMILRLREMPGSHRISLASEEKEQHENQSWNLPSEVEFGQKKADLRRFSDDPVFRVEGAKTAEHTSQTQRFWNNIPVDYATVRLGGEQTALSFDEKLKKSAEKYGVVVKETLSAEEAADSMIGLVWCLLAAVAIISLVLWVQSKSVFRTFVILATFLWAPLGAIPGLAIHGESLNGSALVGFILLAGTIVNNGILLMERIEKNLQQQMSPLEAARLGVEERSLNVVITGLTTILAMLPMIFGGEEGAQMYKSLSVVVVYGTIASTPISFLGIPALLTVRNFILSSIETWKLRWEVNEIAQQLRSDP